MAASEHQIYRARLIAPIASDIVDDGALVVKKGKVLVAGRWPELKMYFTGKAQDLGDVILFPGFVNAHCHLDYTHMAGLLPPPKNFPDWIKGILALKAEWSYSEFAASWVEGARQSLHNGITTVGDIEAVPELIEEAWSSTPLKITSFIELTGVKSQSKPEAVLRQGLQQVDDAPTMDGKRLGLSPHAPYSTIGKLLEITGKAALERELPVSIHVAESLPEFEMFMHASGALYEWLKPQRDVRDCGSCSPVQHLDRHDLLGPHLLAIHVNYLAAGDAALLGRTRTHVVHCPRSHEYFQHSPFPHDDLAAAGVSISIATDSLASVRPRGGRKPELNLFEELSSFANAHPGVAPKEIIKMVTLNPARALGLEKKVGEISPEAAADVIALGYAGKAREVFEWTCHERPAVAGVMLDGNWAREPQL